MGKLLAPKNARTFGDVGRLNADNVQCNASSLYMNADDRSVTIYNPNGESVEVDRDDFIRMINWYQRPQKLRRRKHP